VGEEALEWLWWVVTPFVAAGRRGTHCERRSTAVVVGQRRMPKGGPRRGRWHGWQGRLGTLGEGEARGGGGLPRG
jgi:hypothetical protein